VPCAETRSAVPSGVRRTSLAYRGVGEERRAKERRGGGRRGKMIEKGEERRREKVGGERGGKRRGGRNERDKLMEEDVRGEEMIQDMMRECGLSR
jgi:hypothetical protein